MLVLTRKTNESVIIDGEVEVMVIAVRGNKVRLGFRAPADIAIQRKECVKEGLADTEVEIDLQPDDLVAQFYEKRRPTPARQS